MSKFCKVTAYNFHNFHLVKESYGSKTKELNMVIQKSTSTLLNVDDILMVTPDPRKITLLQKGWELCYFNNQQHIKIGEADNEQIVKESGQNGSKSFLVVPDYMKKTVQFYKVVFKHAIPEGLGLNGVRYDQYIVIDEESWEHLQSFFEGDNQF